MLSLRRERTENSEALIIAQILANVPQELPRQSKKQPSLPPTPAVKRSRKALSRSLQETCRNCTANEKLDGAATSLMIAPTTSEAAC